MTLIFTILWLSTTAQVYHNDAGAREKAFIYRVQQIDEFIARFNNDENSFIRSVYKNKNIPFSVDRTKSVRSLFNYSGNWSEQDIAQFVTTVVNKNNPTYLSFTDNDWYADVTCFFETPKGTIPLQIHLRVSTNSIGSKWSIIAVKNYTATENISKPPEFTNNHHKYITPTSHNNDFISLSHVFEEKNDLNCYFERSFYKDKNQLAFFNAVLSNKIKFKYVSNVKYHFLQIPTYEFQVENYIRDGLNSGWLISRVDKVTEHTYTQHKNGLTTPK